MDELLLTSAARMSAAVRERHLSTVELVEAHLARIAEVNPTLNAVVQQRAEQALAEARRADAVLARGEPVGPLHGVPFTVKDNIPVAGIPMTNGTLGMRDHVPEQDAVVVTRLQCAGAIVLGKTNMPEFGLAGETDNLIYGRTNNPYDPTRTPGGSSGGEAAIIAAGGSPLGIGSDIGGSIRVPAHFTGTVGIKPTMCRIPWHAPVGFGDELRQAGPMARWVEDLALTLPLMAGPDVADPSCTAAPLGAPADVELSTLRAAYFTDNGRFVSTSETVTAVEAAAECLTCTGATYCEDRPPRLVEAVHTLSELFGAAGGAQYRDLLNAAGTPPEQYSPFVQRFLEITGRYQVSAGEFMRLILCWDQLRQSFWRFMQEYDVLICPVSSGPAVAHGRMWDHWDGGNTAPFNLAGLPAVTVRAGTSPQGLPIGVQIVAPPWREDIALAVALHIERELGGFRPPSLQALRQQSEGRVGR